jgi:V8-like Glu-specific endopeptidase
MWQCLKGSCVILLCGFAISCSNQPTKTRSGEESQATQQGQAAINATQKSDALNKYSLDQLHQIISNRSNKALYSSESSDLKDVRTSEIADHVIFREKTLYGFDRRKDYFEIQDPEILKVADSVASMVSTDHLAFDSNSVRISGQTLGQQFKLCRKEAYYDEPVAASCTAFVIGSDLVATAGHCVGGAGSSRIVFGYKELKDASGAHAQLVIPNSQVYRVSQVVAQKADPSGSDFAILKLDREIKDHAPLVLETSIPPTQGGFVYVLGHPSGLPLKLADNATIQAISANGFFTANLDTFGGNSGSPVFSASTHHVQGILVRGGTDYKSEGTCNRAFVCPALPDSTVQCGGESATLISELAKQLGDSNKLSVPLNPPIFKTFTSGSVVSGSGANFSAEYQVTSDPAPDGYKIGGFSYSLSGDRGCNAWSTCKASIEGDRVVVLLKLKGHKCLAPPGKSNTQRLLKV